MHSHAEGRPGAAATARTAADAASQSDDGLVTAELAVVLPALVLVTVLAVWAVGVASLQLRCIDATRTAARALARGEEEAAVRRLALESAPAGALVRLRADGAGLVVVEVRARAHLPGPWSGSGPGIELASRAVAPVEGWPGDVGWGRTAGP